MIETLTWWEICFSIVIVILSAGEFVALWIARRRGLTRNVSRLVTNALLAAVAVAYAWLSLEFAEELAAVIPGTPFTQVPTANWPYLFLAVAIAAISSWELVSHLRAIKAGLTKNVSRILVRIVMLILLAGMLGISQMRWSLYIEHLGTQAEPPSLHGSARSLKAGG